MAPRSPNHVHVGRDFRDGVGKIIKATEEMLFLCRPFMCLHVILVLRCWRLVRAYPPPFYGCVHYPRWDASKGPFHCRSSAASLSGGRRRSFTQTRTGRANNPLRVARVTAHARLLDGGCEQKKKCERRFPCGVGKDAAVAAQQTIHKRCSCRISERQRKWVFRVTESVTQSVWATIESLLNWMLPSDHSGRGNAAEIAVTQ